MLDKTKLIKKAAKTSVILTQATEINIIFSLIVIKTTYPTVIFLVDENQVAWKAIVAEGALNVSIKSQGTEWTDELSAGVWGKCGGVKADDTQFRERVYHCQEIDRAREDLVWR